MKSCLVTCVASLIGAAAVAAQPTPATPRDGSSEPQVRHAVLEDEAVRIDELRVRGQVQRIVVTPKSGGLGAYEIVPAHAGRDPSLGPAHTRGATGQRVWQIFRF